MGAPALSVNSGRRALHSHPLVVDLAVAALALSAVLLSVFPAGHARDSGNEPAALLLLALAYASILLRRRWALTAAIATILSTIGYLATASGHYWWIVPAPAIVLFHLTSTGRQRVGLPVLVVAVGAMLLLVAPLLSSRPWWGAGGGHELTLGTFAAGCIALAAGDSTRNRRSYLAEVEERSRQADRERTRAAERRVEQERLRIARDLHDSVGQHIALINAQAGMATQVFESQPDAAREALAHIRSESRAALDDLRATVGLLRQPDDPAAPVGAPPGLAAAPELVSGFVRSGMRVELQIDGDPRPVPTRVDVAAYRIVQESLTNVTKHSDGANATVRITYTAAAVTVLVENDAPTHPASTDGPEGHGLAGMRERASAAGGTMTAGPQPGGGYLVRAVLPLTKLERA